MLNGSFATPALSPPASVLKCCTYSTSGFSRLPVRKRRKKSRNQSHIKTAYHSKRANNILHQKHATQVFTEISISNAYLPKFGEHLVVRDVSKYCRSQEEQATVLSVSTVGSRRKLALRRQRRFLRTKPRACSALHLSSGTTLKTKSISQLGRRQILSHCKGCRSSSQVSQKERGCFLLFLPSQFEEWTRTIFERL